MALKSADNTAIPPRFRRRDSAGAVYSRSLMFFSHFTFCVLFTAYRDFPLIIVGVATFVATRSNKGRWGRVEVSGGIFLSLLLFFREVWSTTLRDLRQY